MYKCRCEVFDFNATCTDKLEFARFRCLMLYSVKQCYAHHDAQFFNECEVLFLLMCCVSAEMLFFTVTKSLVDYVRLFL